MRTVLLNVGGYSLNDCLASLPVKFRQSGSKSVMQFYNNWKYKYSVMLSQLSFLDVFTEDPLDLICQGVAAHGIVAGIPFEACKSVLDRQHNSPQAFIEDCASSVTSTDGAPRSFHSNNGHFHSSRHAYHSHNHRPPVSNHDDDFITHGHVNGIYTSVIVDWEPKDPLFHQTLLPQIYHQSCQKPFVVFPESPPHYLCMNSTLISLLLVV